MKTPARPHFFTKLSTHFRKPTQPSANPLWQQIKASWHRTPTPDEQAAQDASYQDESWLNSTPHISEMDTVAEMPIVNKLMSHIQDEPEKFAAISGPLLATEIKNKSLIPRVPTSALQAPKQSTDALRPVTISDPYLPSVRMTPTEFAIVPRQRSTTQLPPHMRLDEDIEDSPLMPVEQFINAAILAFHNEHQRLPHRITIAAIRYWRYRISLHTYDPDVFYYKTMPIPITGAPIGEFGIDEVRLD